MGRFLVKLKSQLIQMKRAPRDRRLTSNFFNSINEIKTIEETEFWEVFNEIMETSSPYFLYIKDEFICRNFFPNSYEDMCKSKELPFSYILKYEVRWWSACFNIYSDKLNQFIKLRKEFDTMVLLERYEGALEILDLVQKNFGVSFWLAESRIFVYTKLGKDVNEIIENLPNDYNSFIIKFYSVKNLNTITQAEYKKIVLNALKDIKNYNFDMYMKYRLLPMEYELDAEDYIPLMFYTNDCSLVDKYLVFLDIFEAMIIRDKTNNCKDIMREYVWALKEIDDDHLEAMRFCVDEQKNRLDYQLKDKLLEAKEKLIEGDLFMCRKIAATLLEKSPYCIQAIDIMVETNIKLKDNGVALEGTLLTEILNSLQAVYSLQEGWKNSIDMLYKLINCCSMSCWAREVAASVIKSYSSIGEDYFEPKRRESLQYLDIETVYECIPISEALEYLAYVNSQSKYIQFRRALLEKNYEKAYTIPENMDIKCIVGICDKQKNQDEKDVYLNMLKNNEDTFEILASKCYLKELNLDTHFVKAMHYATSLLINNINKAIYVPWKAYIDKIEEGDCEIRSDICVPILYYVQYKNLPSETKDDLILMCEDFLYFQGEDLPSLLKVHDECYTKNAMVFFLRYVCIPDILSTALAARITNSMDLWKERIDICQILCTLDVKNEKIYEKEIRALTQKRKIYSELKIIEENRIHVNVDGIRARLLEELEGEFARYKIYVDKRWKDVFEAIKQKNGEAIAIWNNDPERVLKELIIKIRDAFVSSTEYGLDFTLSLSIRHGAIEDALRRPLANSRLTTIYNDRKEEYEWDYGLPDAMPKEEKRIIKNAIIQLNNDIEKVINDLKTKYIQVKTEDMHEEGIFDYCINSYEFDQLSFDAVSIGELSEFIDYVFEYLWKKTEINMNAMKQLLREEILYRLQYAYNVAKETIDKYESNDLANLRRRIVNASNEVQNVIEKVCYWFQRSTESKNQDFELDFVFQMGYETICNMHPETRFTKIELEPFQTDGGKIEGKHLKAYSDIFYNLFDNIYKKATTERGNKKIEYSLAQKGDRQYIYLQNDYNCKGDISGDIKKLEELQKILDTEEYLEHVTGEGGTGIPKICKIIRKDLHREGKIKFGLKEEENKFFIEINI